MAGARSDRQRGRGKIVVVAVVGACEPQDELPGVGLLSTGAAMMIALFTNSRHGISEHVAVDDATKQESP